MTGLPQRRFSFWVVINYPKIVYHFNKILNKKTSTNSGLNYDFIIENSASGEDIAKALYGKAGLHHFIYKNYSEAASMYTTVIDKYSGTHWEKESKKELDLIYDRGNRLKEKYYK